MLPFPTTNRSMWLGSSEPLLEPPCMFKIPLGSLHSEKHSVSANCCQAGPICSLMGETNYDRQTADWVEWFGLTRTVRLLRQSGVAPLCRKAFHNLQMAVHSLLLAGGSRPMDGPSWDRSQSAE